MDNNPPSPPTNPAPMPGPQQPSPVSNVTPGAVVYTDSSVPQPASPGKHTLYEFLIIGGVGIGAALILLALFWWILPMQSAHKYTTTIEPLYNTQTADISSVVHTMYAPAFLNSSPSAADVLSDLNTSLSALQTANLSTEGLAAKDHLSVMIGSSWLSSVSKAKSEYASMQQYVSDSQALLQNYKTYVVYDQSINQIVQKIFQKMVVDFNAIGTAENNGDKTAFLAALQNTNNDLQSFSRQVNTLKPSPDLKQFNQDLLSDMNGLQSSMQVLSTVIQSGNVTPDIINAVGEFQSSINGLSNLLNSNPTTNLVSTSLLHSQVVSLESEHPTRQ